MKNENTKDLNPIDDSSSQAPAANDSAADASSEGYTDLSAEASNSFADSKDLPPQEQEETAAVQVEETVSDQENDSSSAQKEDAFDKKEKTDLERFDEALTNQIDDFAQALLNKKAEMALHRDEEPAEKEPVKMTEEEYKQAQFSMASALDELRKERGQVPIDQEEEDYLWSQTVRFEDRFGDDDDFTTASLFKKDSSSSIEEENMAFYEGPSSKDKSQFFERTEVRQEKQEQLSDEETSSKSRKPSLFGKNIKPPKIPKSQSKNKSASKSKSESRTASSPKKETETVTIQQPEGTEQTIQTRPVKKRRIRKKALYSILGVAGLILLLFFGYAYKVMVYDPSNVVTQKQQDDFDKLRDYAEAYDKLLDAEKMELIDMEGDYNSLTDKQKSEINTIFTQFVGQNVPDTIAQLKSMQTITSADDSTYQNLLNFVSSFASMEPSQQNNIVNYLTQYNQLSDELKQTIDDAMIEQTGNDFMAEYDLAAARISQENETSLETITENSADQNQADQTEEENPEETVQSEDVQAQINDLTAQIESLQIDRDNYAAFLAEEGISADGDEILAQYDADIAYLQNLLNSLMQ